MDVKGRINPESHSGHLFFVALTGERSRLIMNSSLKAKGDTSPFILSAVRKTKHQSGHSFKSCHFHSGGKFRKAISSLDDDGVIVYHTTPYTPSPNKLAERTNGIIISPFLTVLGQSKLPVKKWREAVEYEAQAKKIVPHSKRRRFSILSYLENILLMSGTSALLAALPGPMKCQLACSIFESAVKI